MARDEFGNPVDVLPSSSTDHDPSSQPSDGASGIRALSHTGIILLCSVHGILVGHDVLCLTYRMYCYGWRWVALYCYHLAKSYGYPLALCISVASCAFITVSWNSEGTARTTDQGMVIKVTSHSR